MRRIFVYGHYGTGKSVFSHMMAPEAVIGFRNHREGLQVLPQYPWLTCVVPPGEPVWPNILDVTGEPFICDPSLRDHYRELAGIPLDARVCRLNGEGFMAVTRDLTPEGQHKVLRDLSQQVASDFDVLICDFLPFDAENLPDPQDTLISLVAPFDTLVERSKTAVWVPRGGLDATEHQAHLDMVVRSQGAFWHSAPHQARTFWWQDGDWVPLAQMVAAEIQKLDPWYQYHEFGGVPTGPIQGLNGPRRWQCLRALLPQGLGQMRFLDLGANSGYNSIQAALLGATVTSVEPSPRVRQQYDLVKRWTKFDPWVWRQVHRVHEYAQQVPLHSGQFDYALISCVHYHINRSAIPAYRPTRQRDIPHLRPPLEVVLEDLFCTTKNIIIVTNEAHLAREQDPYPEAKTEWVVDTLRAFGAAHVTVHPGDAPDRPIILAEVHT